MSCNDAYTLPQRISSATTANAPRKSTEETREHAALQEFVQRTTGKARIVPFDDQFGSQLSGIKLGSPRERRMLRRS